jgi:hypothetical protein
MIEYIYFVKCPNCEDEHFYFFNDAKECAMNQLSKKPIITQTEVSRNDFGECTDSCDLGTVWSWEDMMKDVSADPEQTIFTKADTVDCISGSDPEFDALDNSIEPVEVRKQVPADMSIDNLAEELSDFQAELIGRLKKLTKDEFSALLDIAIDNKVRIFYGDPREPGVRSREIYASNRTGKYKVTCVDYTYMDDFTDPEVLEEFDSLDELWSYMIDMMEDDFYSPEYNYIQDRPNGVQVPTDMTVESLVEMMEENEDTVECKVCEELHDKTKCHKDDKLGWVCEACSSKQLKESATTTWTCFFDDREVGTVEAATEDEAYAKMEQTWPELQYGKYDGVAMVEPAAGLAEAAATNIYPTELNRYVTLTYSDMSVPIVTRVIPATREDPEDYEEEYRTDVFEYEVHVDDVATVIYENFMTEEDAAQVPGGMEALEDNDAWLEFLKSNFDKLFEKYYKELLDYYEEEAEEAAREQWQQDFDDYEPDPDRAYDEWRDSQYFEESCPRQPMTEALDPRDMVELEYPSLTVTLYGPKRDVDDWDEVEHNTSHVFLVPKVEVATAIWENWITEEDVADVEGGLEFLEDDTAWEKFLETHFDDLFEKYHQQILDYFKDEAAEDFREHSQEEHDLERWANNSKIYNWNEEDDSWDAVEESASQKPFLEEFDDAETHKASLTGCPECGTVSYDMKEQYCTNCGLNL